jgi:hypothetical protein
MKSLIVAFILGLSITSLAFAEGERSDVECSAYSESDTRQNTKQAEAKTRSKSDSESSTTSN